MEDRSNYPLPWCEWLDMPYWQVNIILCLLRDGWRAFQKGKSMAEIIPAIDAIRPEIEPARKAEAQLL